MINLIPPSAQKQVRREYWIRVLTVWLLLIASALVTITILTMPVYVLVRSQLDAYLQEYNQASVESESFKEAELEIKTANDTAELLIKANKAVSFSTVIAELENISQVNNVIVTDFVLLRDKEKMKPVVLKGTAPTRFALTAFRDAVEAHTLFKNVELPLSNLAKDKDILFSISLDVEEQ